MSLGNFWLPAGKLQLSAFPTFLTHVAAGRQCTSSVDEISCRWLCVPLRNCSICHWWELKRFGRSLSCPSASVLQCGDASVQQVRAECEDLHSVRTVRVRRAACVVLTVASTPLTSICCGFVAQQVESPQQTHSKLYATSCRLQLEQVHEKSNSSDLQNVEQLLIQSVARLRKRLKSPTRCLYWVF